MQIVKNTPFFINPYKEALVATSQLYYMTNMSGVFVRTASNDSKESDAVPSANGILSKIWRELVSIPSLYDLQYAYNTGGMDVMKQKALSFIGNAIGVESSDFSFKNGVYQLLPAKSTSYFPLQRISGSVGVKSKLELYGKSIGATLLSMEGVLFLSDAELERILSKIANAIESSTKSIRFRGFMQKESLTFSEFKETLKKNDKSNDRI